MFSITNSWHSIVTLSELEHAQCTMHGLSQALVMQTSREWTCDAFGEGEHLHVTLHRVAYSRLDGTRLSEIHHALQYFL